MELCPMKQEVFQSLGFTNMLLKALWIFSALSVLPSSTILFGISLQAISKETARKTPPVVVSKAIKRLQEIFNMGEIPLNFLPHKKPPQFMEDLFNAVADSNGITKDSRILKGNVVRSFEDKVNFDRKFHFFNLSSFDKHEKMIKAEFRMLRHKQNVLTGKSYRHHFYKVDVYELLDSRVKPWRGNLISSRILPLHTQGWEVFNVTETVSKWIQNNNENYGFLVLTTFPFWNSLKSNEAPGLGRNEKSSYLVIFSDDRGRGSRIKTTPDHGQQKPPLGAAEPTNALSAKKSRKPRAAPYHSRGQPMACQRRPLYVDFEKIGWSGWIISPRGYDAYHCKGSCPFPLGGALGATNHATVQSIVNALKLSGEVGTPCCVPDKLHSISLLYFDDEENVVLKQYEDMVAVSCGCH